MQITTSTTAPTGIVLPPIGSSDLLGAVGPLQLFAGRDVARFTADTTTVVAVKELQELAGIRGGSYAIVATKGAHEGSDSALRAVALLGRRVGEPVKAPFVPVDVTNGMKAELDKRVVALVDVDGVTWGRGYTPKA